MPEWLAPVVLMLLGALVLGDGIRIRMDHTRHWVDKYQDPNGSLWIRHAPFTSIPAGFILVLLGLAVVVDHPWIRVFALLASIVLGFMVVVWTYGTPDRLKPDGLVDEERASQDEESSSADRVH